MHSATLISVNYNRFEEKLKEFYQIILCSIRINEWKNYTIEGYIDQNTKTINFGGITAYNGKFYFDNIKFYVEDENGKMQKYDLPNADFEKGVHTLYIPGWNKATTSGKLIKYKKFTLTYDTHLNHFYIKYEWLIYSNLLRMKPL